MIEIRISCRNFSRTTRQKLGRGAHEILILINCRRDIAHRTRFGIAYALPDVSISHACVCVCVSVCAAHYISLLYKLIMQIY